MKTYNEIIKRAYDKGLGEEMMWKVTDMTNNFIESIRPMHPAEVHKFIEDIENEVCYPKLTEQEALDYVANMDNKDGSKGGHWNLSQTKTYMESKSDFKDLDALCFYVAINMMYSDYYKPSYTTDIYASMAKDFITDKDAPSNKVKRYMSVMK